MITVLNPDQQLKFLPLDKPVVEELKKREKDKNRMVNRVPFMRVTCLQSVLLSDDEDPNKQNNLIDSTFKNILGDKKQIDGFVFELNTGFDEAYDSKRQVIGTELSSLEKIKILNPRRVPPPTLTSFTATIGEEAGFYTTGKLTFTAHSKEQLEFLTPFLLHPGNTIVFEWGHSDKSTTMAKDNDLFSNSDVEEFLNDITYDEKKRITSSQFFAKRQQKVLESEGNYEFLVGVINNFDFSLNENFGYDVSIDVWSISKTNLSSSRPSVVTSNGNDNNIDAKELLINNRIQDFKRWVDYLEKKISGGYINKKDSANVKITQPGLIPVVNDRYSSLAPQNTTPSDDDGDSEFNEFDDVIQIDTRFGIEKYITLGKILEWMNQYDVEFNFNKTSVKLNPYITSKNYKVLFFRNKQPTLKSAKINTESGKLSFNKQDIDDTLISYKSYILPSSIQTSWFTDTSRPETGLLTGKDTRTYGTLGADFSDIKETSQRADIRVEQNLLDIKFYTPRKLDIEDSLGDITNTYYRVDTFVSLYDRYDGNSNDVLREVLTDINEASNNLWDLRLIQTTNTESETNSTEEATITSLNSRDIDPATRNDTYTLKLNQQESIVTSLTFNLGLEGLIADQIYFESTNQSDKSSNASKLNLLLFEKHENGIKLIDKRNQKIAKLRDELNNNGENSSQNSSQNDTQPQQEQLEQYYENDPSDFGLVLATSSSKDAIINGVRNQLQNQLLQSDVNFLDVFTDAGTQSMPTFDYLQEAYLELMSKGNYIASKNEDENQDENNIDSKISPLLESRLQFDLLGCGGFQPLQYLNTDGLPDVYDKRGDFCIMSLSQIVSPTNWTTSISAAFRPRPKNG